MKKILFSIITLFILSLNTKAELITGIHNIPGDYISITDAILDVNFNGVGYGGVVFNVAAGYTESVTGLTLNTTTSIDNNHSIVFQKVGTGANPQIIASGGTGVSDAAITISGTSYVTFNGIDIAVSGTNVEFGYLIENSSATVGSQYDTIKNCKITLNNSNVNSIGVYQMPAFTPTSVAGTNSYNTYHNIYVDNAYNGIYLLSQTTFHDQNLMIDSCMIGTAGAGSIGGNGTQATWGIRCDGVDSVKVWDCEVCNIYMSGTKNIGGIFLSACPGVCQVFSNKVHDIKVTSTSTTAVPIGLRIEELTGETASIYNNLVWGFSHGITTPTATMLCRAISINSQSSYTGTVNVYFNTVSLAMSAYPTSTAFSILYGLANVKNNIFSNTSTAGATSSRYCYYAYAGTINSSDYNDLYIPTGTNNYTGSYGSNKALLSDWRTATSTDANSTNVNPSFTSSTDLHTNVVALNNQGTTITGITTDYSGTTRSNPPDIGAYEFSLYASVKAGSSATAITSIGATLTGTINANNESTTGIIEYGTTTSYGLSSVWTPTTVTGINNTSVSTTITGLLPNTTYHYRLDATTTAGVAYGGDQTFTTATPNLSASTLADFGSICVNTSSGPNSFIITGTNLTTDNLTVAPLNGFTYSTSSGGVYSSSLSIPQSGGNFSQTIYVKFNPTTVQSYNGNIVIGGGGTASYNVAASCTGINSTTIISSQSTPSQSVCVSGTFSPISVTASGTNLSYQWYSNTIASTTGGISLGTANGAQTNTYSPQVTANGTIYYYCTVSGTCGTDTSAVSGAFNVYLITPPTNISLVANATSVTGSFLPSTGADHYLIVRSTLSTLSAAPVNGTTYNTNDPLGSGTVLSYQTDTLISDDGLIWNTLYYYYVFAANLNCSGVPAYSPTPLIASTTTFLPSAKTLNVTAMLQGYSVSGSPTMNQAQDIDSNSNNFNKWSGAIVDTITVQIRSTIGPDYAIEQQFYGSFINTDGTITLSGSMPSGITGYQYIVIKHWESIETWSDSVDFTPTVVNYNFFANPPSTQFQNNMANTDAYGNLVEGNLLWAGDITNGNDDVLGEQDGYITLDDVFMVYDANLIILSGYNEQDVNGDGYVTLDDVFLVYDNNLVLAQTVNPFTLNSKKK